MLGLSELPFSSVDRKWLYSPSPGSDVAHLLAKHSFKSPAPSKIAHTGSRIHKNKECGHVRYEQACMLMSLPENGKTEYRGS